MSWWHSIGRTRVVIKAPGAAPTGLWRFAYLWTHALGKRCTRARRAIGFDFMTHAESGADGAGAGQAAAPASLVARLLE